MKDEKFVEACKQATLTALKGKVDEHELNKFVENVSDEQLLKSATRAVGVPGPVEAKGETYTVLVYGYVKCTPTHLDHVFEANHWGLGLAGLTSYGTMYTAYESYDALFRNTTGYHAQGVAEAGGIFQITWFNKDAVPVGQFNSVAGGIGAFEVGGKGKWTKK